MKAEEKADLIENLEKLKRGRRTRLKELGIPEPTYYRWRKAYKGGGLEGLQGLRTRGGGKWNRLIPEEEDQVLEVGREHPELSPRLLSVKITDEERFSVSESTVYRILKQKGLIEPRPLPELPSGREWRHKTNRINEIWQCDGTFLFVVGWGYYKLIPLLDDYSRKIISWALMPDETADSISEVVEMGLECTGMKDLSENQKPKLLSDNGSGFIAHSLAAYLDGHGVKHLFGRPYHPQTQGKIERFNRRVKLGLCLLIYCSPDELRVAIKQTIDRYNETPHESLKNISPNDMYMGRQEEILKKRAAKKSWTLARRKIINLELGGRTQPRKTVG